MIAAGVLSGLLLAGVATQSRMAEVPDGRTEFAGMSDLQIDGWIRWNSFHHAANVYRCQGMTQRQAERRLEQALGRTYAARGDAIATRLRARYGDAYQEDTVYSGLGYVTTPVYCRHIRYVVQDLLRAHAELERRLGLVH